MSKKTVKTYIVRCGSHSGQYIGVRLRPSAEKKYAWVKNRYDAVEMTLQQAKGVVRAYGGEIVLA